MKLYFNRPQIELNESKKYGTKKYEKIKLLRVFRVCMTNF